MKRLLSAFDELETAISKAKHSLNIRIPLHHILLQRIENYEEVLKKQRGLASKLCDYLAEQNWEEVARHVKLINGLSSLVHGDASEITNQFLTPETPLAEEKLAN